MPDNPRPMPASIAFQDSLCGNPGSTERGPWKGAIVGWSSYQMMCLGAVFVVLNEVIGCQDAWCCFGGCWLLGKVLVYLGAVLAVVGEVLGVTVGCLGAVLVSVIGGS